MVQWLSSSATHDAVSMFRGGHLAGDPINWQPAAMTTLFNPTLDEVFGDGSALGINHQYVPLAGDSWSEADEYATEETAFLEQFADDPNGIEEVRDEDFENDNEPDSLYPLDLGVAGLVHFVSAAGMVPISSCNGLDGHRESSPVVALACDPARLDILKGLVAKSSCNLFLDPYGDGNLIVIQSDDWHHLRELGNEISRARDVFDRCPPPLSFEDFEEDDDPDRNYYSSQDGVGVV